MRRKQQQQRTYTHTENNCTHHRLGLVVEVRIPAHADDRGVHHALEHGVAVVDARRRVVHPLADLFHVHVCRRDAEELGASPEALHHRRRQA